MPSYNFEYDKIISIDWNGEVFVLTIRNELTNAYSYKYSYDGLDWTNGNLPSALTTKNPYTVKWLGSNFVMGGDLVSSAGNTIAKSSDGINYSITKATNMYPIYDIESNLEYKNTIQFSRNMTLALGGISGDTSKIAYSLDEGITWNSDTNTNTIFTVSAKNAVWNGRIWVAVGSGTNSIATSSDGIHWVGRGSYVLTQANSVAWSKEKHLFVAIGTGPANTFATSVDGVYWVGNGSTVFNGGYDVQWNGSIWVAVGVAISNNKSIAYSYDGKTWQTPTQTNLFSARGERIEWNGVYWIAHGVNSDNTYSTATSQDGITWNVTNGSTNTITFYNGSYYLTGGNNVSYSVDANTWTNVSITNISYINNFAWNHPDQGYPSIQPLTIACGEGTNTLGYSYDGLYWYGLGNSIFTTRANKSVWNGKTWVAVGTGNYWVATSSDGIEWKGRENTLMTEGLDVAWNGTVFIAVGYGTTNMARSIDGISWSKIENSTSIFSTQCSAIEWTGSIWLAYGSGSNTTAYSSSLDGSVWNATPNKNMCITDASSVFSQSGYFTSSSLSGFNASASSQQTGNESYHAFNNDFSTTLSEWYSNTGLYNSDGSYAGSTSTSYNTSLSANGEWIQLDLSSPQIIKYYYVVLSINSGVHLPSQWVLLGSNDNSTWSQIDSFTSSASTPPDNNTYYNFVALPLNVYANTTAYQYYRVVFERTFGGNYVAVADIDFYIENANSNTLSRYVKPIVTKNAILYQTNVLPFNGVKQSVYVLADLSNNIIRDAYFHSNYVNTAIDGFSNYPITSHSFDGNNLVITNTNGKVGYITNTSSNTNLNIDVSFNGGVMNSNMTTVYSSCWNKNFIVLGGTGGNVITYNTLRSNVTASWNASINANDLFTTVYNVSSNPGYGFVYIPNVLCFKSGEKLSVVGPKAYNEGIYPETDINFNLRNLA